MDCGRLNFNQGDGKNNLGKLIIQTQISKKVSKVREVESGSLAKRYNSKFWEPPTKRNQTSQRLNCTELLVKINGVGLIIQTPEG